MLANETDGVGGPTNSLLSNDSNASSSSISPSAERFVYYGEAVIQPTILAVGVLTNTLSIIVLIGAKIPLNLRICIVALTLCDLGATVSGLGSVIVEVVYFQGDIKFGYLKPEAVAAFSLYYIYTMFLSMSASIVILLAAIRCCLVMHPVTSRQFLTPLRTKLLCMATVLVVLVLFLPTVTNVLWQSCSKEKDAEFCVDLNPESLGKFANPYLYVLLSLFGPVLVLFYVACFVAIAVTLHRSRDMMSMLTERSCSVSSERGTQRRRSITARVTRTLLAILVLDVVCTLPTVVQGLGLIVPSLSVFSNNDKVFDVVAEMFLSLRPAYNFWLYAFTHKEFQHRGWQLLWMMEKRCRCFLLGLIRAPSSEDISSRTHSTMLGHDVCTPASPAAGKYTKVMLTTNGATQTLLGHSNGSSPVVKAGRTNITTI